MCPENTSIMDINDAKLCEHAVIKEEPEDNEPVKHIKITQVRSIKLEDEAENYYRDTEDVRIIEIKKEPVDHEEVSLLGIKEESIEKVFIKEEALSLEDENAEPEGDKFPILADIDFDLAKVKNEPQDEEMEYTNNVKDEPQDEEMENANNMMHHPEEYDGNQSSSQQDAENEHSEEYAVNPLISTDSKDCHKCELCGKMFKRLSTFKCHILDHRKNLPHECDYCSLRFRLVSELYKHEIVHLDKMSKCRICGRICKNEGYLKLHSVIHTGRIFPCKECGKEFTKPEKLNGHMACHRPNHKCKICGKVFRLKLLLKEHSHTHSSEMQDIKVQPQDYKFSVTNFSHAQERVPPVIHQEKLPSRDHKCHICERNFQRLNALKSHLKTHNIPKHPVEECKVCSKKFSSLRSLQKHVQIHVNECPYECKICNKKFTCSYSLREHTHIHKVKDQIQCKFCKKTFKDTNLLSLHICMDSFIVLYECEVCGETFQCKDDLESHSLSHKGRSYECMICSKVCTSLLILKRHVRFHVEDGFHECMVCSKSYRCLESLKQHIACHASETKDIKHEMSMDMK